MRLIDADKIDYTVTMVGRDEYAGYRAVAFESDIDDMPTVDAVEVVHGEWKARNHRIIGDWSIMCSVCGYRERRGPAYEISDGMYNYCPNCGAKMDGERKVNE